MPIFEFQCKECRGEFKTLRRTEKLPDVTCPECGTDRVIRLLSVTARSANSETPESCGVPSGMCCGMKGSGCGSRN